MSLLEQIAAIDEKFSGTIGVCAVNLSTGERLEYQADMTFYPASTIKLPLLYEVFRGVQEGRWSPDDQLTLTPENIVEGSGVLLDLTPGLKMSVKDVATLMIVVSDNTATNMLVDLAGTEGVNRSMEELGAEGVRMFRKIGMNTETPLGTATPRGMARLMELIATHKVLTPEACMQMIDILKRQKFKELTNRYIAATDAEDDTPSVRIASKSGWIRGVRNDVALLWTPRASYVLSMYSKDCKDRRFYHDNEASLALARISQAVYEAWGRLRSDSIQG